MFVDVYVSKNLYFSFIYICTINGFLLPKIPHSWFLKNRDSKKQTQKAWLSDIAIFFHVQIHCACQWIMTLPPKILWPTALLNTWNIITFPKSSFYHTNHTFLTNINVWMMDFSSINTRIKKISSAQNTILCREWLLQKLTFRHSEITIFNHSHNPTQRTFGEPQAPSVYIYRAYGSHCISFYWNNKGFIFLSDAQQTTQSNKFGKNKKHWHIFAPSALLGSGHGTFMDLRIDFLWHNSSKNIKEHSCVD